MQEVFYTVIEWLFWIGIFIVFYTYLGYGILLYVLVKVKELFKKPISIGLPEPLPEVTLFIAAYNEEDIVASKMKNSHALAYPTDKLKIVWVTDGSNDRTNELLKQYPEVTVLFQPQRKGKTAALNRGIQYITTPYVIFTDANTMLNKEAVHEIIRQFSNSAVGAAGELFAVRTELFEQMPSDTLLDDFILSLRIAQKGYKIAYCKEAYATETASLNMKEEEKRKIRIAAGGLQSVWRLRNLFNIFRYGILSFQFVSHRVLRWTITPVMLFLLIPLNIILACYGGFTYIFLLLLQVAFYIMAYAGYMMEQKNVRNKLFFIPYYFSFMNINVIRGFFYLAGNKGNGAWEKAKRIQ